MGYPIDPYPLKISLEMGANTGRCQLNNEHGYPFDSVCNNSRLHDFFENGALGIARYGTASLLPVITSKTPDVKHDNKSQRQDSHCDIHQHAPAGSVSLGKFRWIQSFQEYRILTG